MEASGEKEVALLSRRNAESNFRLPQIKRLGDRTGSGREKNDQSRFSLDSDGALNEYYGKKIV